jgi:MFS family permease
MVALSVHLLPYLTGRGHDAAFAAAATGSLGLMQIVGRLIYAPLGDRFALRFTAATVLLVQPVALLVLLLGRDLPGILLFVVLFGAGRGAMTLLRPLSVAAFYGPARFGSVNGVLSLLLTLAQAGAPFAAGAGYDLLGSYEPVLWALLAISFAAAGAALRLRPEAPRASA